MAAFCLYRFLPLSVLFVTYELAVSRWRIEKNKTATNFAIRDEPVGVAGFVVLLAVALCVFLFSTTCYRFLAGGNLSWHESLQMCGLVYMDEQPTAVL